MELMSLLDTEGMNKLRDHFEKKINGGGDKDDDDQEQSEACGLSLYEFVRAMMLRLGDTGLRDDELAAKLIDLFEQVDVNGDGTMEWEEFSSFCIEAAMAATQKAKLQINETYKERTKYTDNTSRGNRILSMRYFDRFKTLMVCEEDYGCVKVYDPRNGGIELMHEIDMDEATVGTRKGSGGKALFVEHITICDDNRTIFAVSSSTLLITFWDASHYAIKDKNTKPPRHIHSVYASKPQMTLRWSHRAQLLFSSGSDADILVFSVCLDTSSNFEASHISTLKRHQDIVRDLLCVDEHMKLISGSLDGQVLVWDIPVCPKLLLEEEDEDEENGAEDAGVADWPIIVYKGKRIGHKRGIRSLDYCGDGLIISASFDMTACGWDVSGMSNKRIFCLRGHTAPLVGCGTLSNGEFVTTLDVNGIFKVWDTRLESNIMDVDRCVQTFTTEAAMRLDHTAQQFKPSAMILIQPSNMIVAASKKMHIWDRVAVGVQGYPAVACVYNNNSATLIAAVEKDVKIWNAIT